MMDGNLFVHPDNEDEEINLPQTVETGSTQKPKKRPCNFSEWKKIKRKKLKAEGKEYLSAKGKLMPARNQRMENCLCKCKEKMTAEEFQNEYDKFCTLGDHSLQNTYLQGRVEVSRVYTTKNGNEKTEYKYVLKHQRGTIQLCQTFWLGLYGIERSRIVDKVLNFEGSTKDGRGKHNNHHHIDDEFVDRVKVFFTNLPQRKSHYSQHDNPNRTYIEAHWTVPYLYNKFREENPGLKDGDIKLSYFRYIFNTKFNIKNGVPRTDICNSCERMFKKLEIARAQRPVDQDEVSKCVKELEDHHVKAEQFQEEIEKSRKSFLEWSILLDFKQNIPLPVTNTQDEFFLSQLWINVFGIVHLQSGQATIFPYSEHFAAKGCNEVISCLDWYVSNVVPPDVKNLKIFMDNNYGQNKNQFVFAYLQYLANTRFENITVIFPLPGHSRMPIDGVFGVIEIKQRLYDKVNSPSDVVSIIKEAQHKKPFKIVYVEHPLTNDLCNDETPVVNVKDFKSNLATVLQTSPGISTIREIIFEKHKVPICDSSIRFGGVGHEQKLLKPSTTEDRLILVIKDAKDAYFTYKDISSTKLKNIRHLIECVYLEKSCIFFESLTESLNDPEKNKDVMKNFLQKPRPWRTAYRLYVDESVNKYHTSRSILSIRFSLMARVCAERWKEMEEEEKNVYVQKSADDPERFAEESKMYDKESKRSKGKGQTQKK